MRLASMLAAAFAVLLAFVFNTPAFAAITVGGDAGEVYPADPTMWTMSTYGYIGRSDGKAGEVIVDAGSVLLSHRGYLGNVAGSTGTVIVSGTESMWSTMFLYVGNYGTGAMVVDDDGLVANKQDAFIGCMPGSSGTARVTGAGSTWTCGYDLYVGLWGTGLLTVESGGAVNVTRTLFASTGDLAGDGVINTTGLVADVGLLFDATHGATQALQFGAGGALNLMLNGSGSLGAGYRTIGSLAIADGVEVVSGWGFLGYLSGSIGTAVVTGSGASWSTNAGQFVGRYGSGTLTVADGGSVTNALTCLGRYPGSNGTAVVTGVGSIATETCLTVGWAGAGSLRVADGGFISNCGESYVARDHESSGTVVVAGTGSTWTSTGSMYVGDAGVGSLTVAGGGTASDASGYLGLQAGSGGSGLITGTGSTWTNSGSLSVGVSGAGTLRIELGGAVTSLYGQVGTLAGGSGTAVVTGSGSTWTVGWEMSVGGSGTGTLTVADGARVSSRGGYVGQNSGSRGTVVVTGSDSIWAADNGDLVLGIGSLLIGDGAKITADSVRVSPKFAVNLRVSGHGLVMLGSSSAVGNVTNSGKVNFYADAFSAAGMYSPITEYLGRAITWSGSGTYSAVGGAWDNTAKTFTVAAATELAAGTSDSVTTGERLLFTAASGKRAGASFGAVDAGVTLAADVVDAGELAGLPLGSGESVLAAWDFTTNFAGTALLAFEVGIGAKDVKVYRYDGSAWQAVDAQDMIYDSHGVVSFTASEFGAYAIVGIQRLGDFNGDGVVDQADYTTWADHFLADDAIFAPGSSNADGRVDQADYTTWADNFGKTY